jgi:hypothetical protein
MKKILIPLLVLIAFVFGMPDNSMARKGRGHYKHHNHGYYNKHHHYNKGYYRPYAYGPRNYVYYASPPVVYAPPPVVYAPPPVYGPGYYGPSSGGYLNFGIVFD